MMRFCDAHEAPFDGAESVICLAAFYHDLVGEDIGDCRISKMVMVNAIEYRFMQKFANEYIERAVKESEGERLLTAAEVAEFLGVPPAGGVS